MKISEQNWATIGKIGAALATAVGLIVGLIQIGDRIRGPEVVAIVESREHLLAPKFREDYVTNIAPEELQKLIGRHEGVGKTPADVLAEVKARLVRSPSTHF